MLEKVVKQQKIINLNAVIIHIYFQCARMAMNNISTSGGLTFLIPMMLELPNFGHMMTFTI